MSKQSKLIKKYRPSLSSVQISHILYLAKGDISTMSSATMEQSKSIVSTLAPFLAKIQNDAMEASFIVSPKIDTMDMIGETMIGEENKLAGGSTNNNANDIDDNSSSPVPNYPNTLTAPRQAFKHNLECYTKYKLALAADRLEDITLEQIECAKEHMYLNDLMSLEEDLAYETELSKAAAL